MAALSHRGPRIGPANLVCLKVRGRLPFVAEQAKMLVYKAMYKFLDDEGFVHGEVLDFPGAITCGRDLISTRSLLASALVDMAETHLLDGQPLPLPDPSKSDPESDIEEPIYLLLRGANRIRIVPLRATD